MLGWCRLAVCGEGKPQIKFPETIPNRQDGRCCAASAALLSPPTPSSKPRFLKPSCMPSCHAAWHMYFTRACYKIIPLLKSHHVLKSHDFRHFESSTTPCPNNVLRPHYMGPRGHAGPNLCRVDRPLSWSCCYLAVQIQAWGLEPGTSAGKGQVMGVRPEADGAPGV